MADRTKRTREMISLAKARYDFGGKTGVAMCCANGDTNLMPLLIGSHSAGEDIMSFDVPECDFCVWLHGFTDEIRNDRGAAEAKLAEVSFRCKTMFFSSGLARPVEETVLRHTRYEHAIEIGRAGGRPVYMCW